MFKLIVAKDSNSGIGYKGKMPWECKEDLKHYFNTTKNENVVYGSTTYRNLPKLSSKIFLLGDAIETENNPVVNRIEDVEEFINKYKDSEEIFFVAGGRATYETFIDHCNELIITELNDSYQVDTYFPELPNKFTLISSKPINCGTINIYRSKYVC